MSFGKRLTVVLMTLLLVGIVILLLALLILSSIACVISIIDCVNAYQMWNGMPYACYLAFSIPTFLVVVKQIVKEVTE